MVLCYQKKECIQLLKKDVTPALGCTEPVCIALCLAHAAKVLDEEIISIDVDVNIGIFKNGMSAVFLTLIMWD